MRTVNSVLIVDDDEDDREMFCEAIEKISSETKCFHALSGLEALEILETKADSLPDYIFLDLNMPRLSGKQCLERLKQMEMISHIPIFIYSTSNLPNDKHDALRLGASGYILKPTNFDSLCKELKSVFCA